MSTFTKTVIVDKNDPNYPNSINAGVDIIRNTGGTVIVEAGVYEIDNITPGKMTVSIPSNVTLIGRGNVVVKVTQPGSELGGWVHAFTNADHTNGNSNIVISGFKIVVACGSYGRYDSNLIFMRNVSNSRIEKLFIEAPAEENPHGVNPERFAILIYSFDQDCVGNVICQCVIRNFGNQDPGTASYNYGNGIGFSRQPTTTGMCRDSVVKNNHVSSCLFNVACWASERIVIKNNVFTRAMGQVAATYDVKKALNMGLEGNYLIIRGNQLNETDAATGAHGLYPSGCAGLIISGNIVCRNGAFGIKPRFGCTQLDPQGKCPLNNVIRDQYYVISWNVCNENGTNGSGNGLHLQGGTKWMTLFGNVTCENTANGLRVQEDDDYLAENILVVGNVAFGNGNMPTDADISVIVDAKTKNVETGNLCGSHI